uniref:MARVEL domain containing 2b n=1 Tax=Petromyzon marinus TaxID=7757 RepID=S4RGN6_PETMA
TAAMPSRAPPPDTVRNNLRTAPSPPPSPPRAISDFRYLDIATSADPLPPPPLPLQPPVGDVFSCSSEPAPAPSLPDIKPVHRFIPDSVKTFFSRRGRSQGNRGHHDDDAATDDGSRSLAPVLASSSDYYPSYGTRREKEGLLPDGARYDGIWEGPSLSAIPTSTFQTYSQREEEYRVRYSYMKSWPGLLRLLGAVQLLLGAIVFACVCAYIYKDNEWYNFYGYGRPSGSLGIAGGAGSYYGNYNYDGPKTPFVLVVAGLAWLVTVILLGVGMTMYYRAVLLDADWWPVTEAAINGALFLLYLSAAIVYVNDLNRGGLCSFQSYNNPLSGVFCRQEGGQVGATIFLFCNTIAYLASTAVGLKMWRHENARKRRERAGVEDSEVSIPRLSRKKSFQDLTVSNTIPDESIRLCHPQLLASAPKRRPEIRNGHIPSGHIPKPLVVPDYVAKYPPIGSDEERDRYKAVFTDQYAEYRELSAELHAVARRFTQLEGLIKRLPTESHSQQEMERVANVFQEYEKKKNDPAFLEKKERCEYLKAKLAHIKQRIQEYDKVMTW